MSTLVMMQETGTYADDHWVRVGAISRSPNGGGWDSPEEFKNHTGSTDVGYSYTRNNRRDYLNGIEYDSGPWVHRVWFEFEDEPPADPSLPEPFDFEAIER